MNIQSFVQSTERRGTAALSSGLTKLNQEVLTQETKAELLATARLTTKLVTTAYFLTFGSLTTAARFSFDSGSKFRSLLQSTLEDLLVQLELITVHPITTEELRAVVESMELEDLGGASEEENNFVMEVLTYEDSDLKDLQSAREDLQHGHTVSLEELKEELTRSDESFTMSVLDVEPYEEESPHSIAMKSMLEVMSDQGDTLMEVNLKELKEELATVNPVRIPVRKSIRKK